MHPLSRNPLRGTRPLCPCCTEQQGHSERGFRFRGHASVKSSAKCTNVPAGRFPSAIGDAFVAQYSLERDRVQTKNPETRSPDRCGSVRNNSGGLHLPRIKLVSGKLSERCPGPCGWCTQALPTSSPSHLHVLVCRANTLAVCDERKRSEAPSGGGPAGHGHDE